MDDFSALMVLVGFAIPIAWLWWEFMGRDKGVAHYQEKERQWEEEQAELRRKELKPGEWKPGEWTAAGKSESL